jgi:hypothetical protein
MRSEKQRPEGFDPKPDHYPATFPAKYPERNGAGAGQAGRFHDKLRIAERLLEMAFFIVPMSFGMRVGGIVRPKQPKTKRIYPPALGDGTVSCI